MTVQTLYTLRARLKQLCDIQNMKWRAIGEMPEFNGVSFGTLNAIYHGREPKATETRRKLGLPFIEVREIHRNGSGRFSKRTG